MQITTSIQSPHTKQRGGKKQHAGHHTRCLLHRIRYILLLIGVLLSLPGAGRLQEQTAVGVTDPALVNSHNAMLQLYECVTNSSQDALQDLERGTSDAAMVLGETGISSAAADVVLAKLAASYPAIMNVIA
jgi:hypothetical protein